MLYTNFHIVFKHTCFLVERLYGVITYYSYYIYILYFQYITFHYSSLSCFLPANLDKVRGAISELFLRTVAAAARGVQEAPCFRFGVIIKFKGRGISINYQHVSTNYQL